MDNCVRCGGEYVVNSARQKYCPDCSHQAVREIDRLASIAWNHTHKETYYPDKNRKRNAQRAKNPEPFRIREKESRDRRKRNLK